MSDYFLQADDGDEDQMSLDDETPKSDTERLGVTEMEKMAASEISEVLKGFIGRGVREEQRFWDAVDSEYWFAVCFQTREQKDEFLEKSKMVELGDKYIDGMALARMLGIKLVSRVPDMPRPKVDTDYAEMALDFDDI